MAGNLTTVWVEGIEYGLRCLEDSCDKHQGVFTIDAADGEYLLANGNNGRIDGHPGELMQRKVKREAWKVAEA